MVVALAGNSLERETSTCNGAMPPPAWSHESSIIRIARVSATTREDCLSCPVSGAKYGKGSGGDSQLCPSHSCWDKGGMVDGHVHSLVVSLLLGSFGDTDSFILLFPL